MSTPQNPRPAALLTDGLQITADMIANLIVKVMFWHRTEADDLCRRAHGSMAADARIWPVCALGRLVTRVWAMTSAAVARLICQMLLARLDGEGIAHGNHQSWSGGWAAAGGLGRGC
jgi:hypothetical protein